MITDNPILSISQLNRNIRYLLEQEVGPVRVEGEISNLSKPISGHFYFTLKDATAQIRCVFFKNRHNFSTTETLHNGKKIIAEGILSLYEARGDYQLIIHSAEEAGHGDLYLQFEQLKAKLQAQGLFDSQRKKPLPLIPSCIGIISSSTGAALKDILTTLKRRFPLAPIILYQSEVQGKQATAQLCSAIRTANQEQRCNVLILARGGGSIEDLWAFNEEPLAYAIAESSIPIITGIGHETDFTIADFVADKRAATPTAAAETAAPHYLELLGQLEHLKERICTTMQYFLATQKKHLQWIQHRLLSPKPIIERHWQSIDYLEQRLIYLITQLSTQHSHRLYLLHMQLASQHPKVQLQQQKSEFEQIFHTLRLAMANKIKLLKDQLNLQCITLHTLSPLATLERGYAIATHEKNIVLTTESIKTKDIIEIRLAKGQFTAQVIHINK